MHIAVDAMGGDHAPAEIVAGAVQAAACGYGISRLSLVGDQDAIATELARLSPVPDTLQIIHASEVVEMHEAPAAAIRRKRDSSIGRAVDLVKKGDAAAVFSAGNTGAAVAAATLKLRTLEGVSRPAIAAVFPTPTTPFVLLDAGANPDCTADMLCQFAVMGAVYSREILGVAEPRIGLLSIGEEDAKGNDITKETFRILRESALNFIGNVESKAMFEGRVDVVICDGFVGNIVLKTSESVARAMGNWIKSAVTSSGWRKLGAAILTGAFRQIRRTSDPEVYGGAPLLGANGVCIIGHGSSSAFAVQNGIRVAAESVQHHLNHLIVEGVQGLKQPV
jgi:glycerol-3-phosphate acyltransferase PlsX